MIEKVFMFFIKAIFYITIGIFYLLIMFVLKHIGNGMKGKN